MAGKSSKVEDIKRRKSQDSDSLCLAKRTVTQLYNQVTIQGETAERRAAAPERGTNKTKQKT
jgi:hypothetical protein